MILLHHHYICSFGLTVIPTVIDAETEGQLEEVTGLKLKALTRTQVACSEMHCVCLIPITWTVPGTQTTYHPAAVVSVACFATLGIVASYC